jgi:hypothetical protein
MSDFYGKKRYEGRAGAVGDYSKVEGSFNVSSNDQRIAERESEYASAAVSGVISIVGKDYESMKQKKEND